MDITDKDHEENCTILIEKSTFIQEIDKPKCGKMKKHHSGFINIQGPLEKHFRLRNDLLRELIAEYFGTFILCFFGISSVAQYVFLNRAGDKTAASFLSINLGFGIGVTAAILVVGKVSGCHINPAVSLAMFLTGRLSFIKLILYSIVQVVGSFHAASVVFVLYYDAFMKLKPIDDLYSIEIAGIFATYPGAHLSVLGGLFDQIMGTWILIVIVLAVSDKRNIEIPHASVAILLGLTVTVIGTSFAFNCGYAINPARDLGPRLFTFMAGWGSQVFTASNHFFWIPIVGPLIGSIFGTLTYLFLISNHL